MAITFVGSATGTNTATLPAHNSGDLIIVFACRENTVNSVPPSTASGFTSVSASPSTGLFTYRVATRVSNGSLTDIGTWTNATAVVALIYRGAVATGPTFDVAITSTSPVTYPALTITGAPRLVVGFAASSLDTNTMLQAAPAGMVNRTSIRNTVVIGAHDSNGAVASWTAKTTSIVSSNSIGFTIAISEAVTATGSWYVMFIGE